jgi:CubicO group peptidase (beta-lactamase class C family)
VALLAALAFALAGCGFDDGSGPVANSGVWSTASPADEGVDERLPERLDAVLEGEYSGINGILVARNGRIVYERYRNGTSAGTKFPVYSVTKTVVGMLVGIAVGSPEQDIGNADQLLGDILTPEVVAAEDQRVQEATLRHLLTMRAGWPDQQATGRNLVLKIVNRPLVRPPGKKFEYDNGSAHLMSAAVSRATGFPTTEYARQGIFQPLGIVPGKWDTDAEGIALGSTGLHLSVRDMAKLGELYLNDGEWEGKQIVHARWVAASTKSWVDTDDPNFGYGYYWWIDKPTKSYVAIGYGGQVLWVNPAKNVVVAVTSDPAREPRLRTLVTRMILPAVED